MRQRIGAAAGPFFLSLPLTTSTKGMRLGGAIRACCFGLAELLLDWARRQGVRSWELRAATSLAGLWRDKERTEEARELLAPVYGQFTEGFETTDLKAAKPLVD